VTIAKAAGCDWLRRMPHAEVLLTSFFCSSSPFSSLVSRQELLVLFDQFLDRFLFDRLALVPKSPHSKRGIPSCPGCPSFPIDLIKVASSNRSWRGRGGGAFWRPSANCGRLISEALEPKQRLEDFQLTAVPSLQCNYRQATHSGQIVFMSTPCGV